MDETCHVSFWELRYRRESMDKETNVEIAYKIIYFNARPYKSVTFTTLLFVISKNTYRNIVVIPQSFHHSNNTQK